MFKNKKLLLIVFVLILFILISIWFTMSNQQLHVTQKRDIIEGSKPDKYLKDVEFLLYNKEKTARWKLTSDEVNDFNNKGLIKLEPVFIQAYDNKTDKLIYTINGDTGRYLSQKDTVEVTGPATFNKGKYILTAGFLQWFQQKNTIKGNNGFQLEAPEYIVTGSHFQTDTLLQKVIVYGDKKDQAHLRWKEKKDETK